MTEPSETQASGTVHDEQHPVRGWLLAVGLIISGVVVFSAVAFWPSSAPKTAAELVAVMVSDWDQREPSAAQVHEIRVALAAAYGPAVFEMNLPGKGIANRAAWRERLGESPVAWQHQELVWLSFLLDEQGQITCMRCIRMTSPRCRT